MDREVNFTKCKRKLKLVNFQQYSFINFHFLFYVISILAKYLSRAALTLHEVQCQLDHDGASDLVIELVVKSVNSPSIFEEAVTLGIALLEGGNPVIQKSMHNKLLAGDLSHAFFKVCTFTNFYLILSYDFLQKFNSLY